jgi:hypothetical protein
MGIIWVTRELLMVVKVSMVKGSDIKRVHGTLMIISIAWNKVGFM